MRRIQQPQFLLPLSLRSPKFLQLNHVKIQFQNLQNRLVAPVRPPPQAVPSLVPHPVLEVRQRECPEEYHAVEVFPAVYGPQRRPEDAAVAVGHGEVGGVGDLAEAASRRRCG
ncbi:hypothetical protein ABFS82_08G039200 [Erythranthe guttata]|uniref:Uncharacterized protein n=2 Tax=Erythranthe guttata TaxID=4155 RepID=A0A022RUV2_ERYGU|nr:hypothetical protein MIMGU_mgv1a016678mg [Erythranthe guttata]